MEAYKELFRHKRNEEKRYELISCFQLVWTANNIFGRMREGDIRWHLTPPKEFLPEDLAAWTATPIRIHRTSPSPDVEADFAARSDFNQRVADSLQGIADSFHPQPQAEGPPNSLFSQPSTSHQPHGQSGEGSRRTAQCEETSANSDNSNREGSPPTSVDASEPLHTRQRKTQADSRPEAAQLDGIGPGSSNTHVGTQLQTLGLSLKRKSPHSTEEQEHSPHNALPERVKFVSRCKRKCRRVLRPALPQLSPQRPLSTVSSPHSPPLELPTVRVGEHLSAKEGCSLEKIKLRSRHKTRCRFGPRKHGSDIHPHDVRESHSSP